VAARVHLIAPAGSCKDFIETIGARTPEGLVSIVQKAMGPAFSVTVDAELLTAEEDELRGGRFDDERRAADIETALADSEVCALVAIRGGAWLARILPRINFSVLDRRTSRIAVWGFSELTTLVNIVASHPNGLGVYGMGPAFLRYGLKRYAQQQVRAGGSSDRDPEAWAASELGSEFAAFFQSLSATLHGACAPIEIEARLVRGHAGQCCGRGAFVGGNLTVFSTLIGSRYDACVAPDNRWLALEDFNDKPERFDRFLSHLTLAGYFDRCRGVLLGDFHLRDRDLLDVVLAMLDYHLPPDQRVPVLATRQVGHVWPMTPLPLNIVADLTSDASGHCRVAFPQNALTLFPSR